MYIKDLKSSNGTFVNGNRLSEEGVESAPHELKEGDVLEFGVDIANEDGEGCKQSRFLEYSRLILYD